MGPSDNRERVVVIGFGWVGQANALALSMMGYEVGYFDPGTPPHHYGDYGTTYQSLKKLSNAREWDGNNTWYIVCVGDRVSEDGVQDISHIKSALESLKGVQGGVMLRSTVLPDLLQDLHFDYYMPEFLHEKKAVEECIAPYLLVVGVTKGARGEPSFVKRWRTQARKDFTGSPHDASSVKYLSNLWNAMRIAFVNEFGDAIGRPHNKEELARISGIVDFLFDHRSYLRYGKAFGGHCLPKDSRAFTAWYVKKHGSMPLMSGMYAANANHQKIEQQFPLLPEWYSDWPNRHMSGSLALRELIYSIRKNIVHPLRAIRRLFH